MRPATPAEIAHWDDLVTANPDGGHSLQTRAWGEFKRGYGWHPEYLVAELDGARLAILVLRKRFQPFGYLWYVPKGPGVADLEQLRIAVGEFRRQHGVVAVKIEPELQSRSAPAVALRSLGLRSARHDVQITRATIIVDLRRDDDTLLASFKPKTRYNIRLASRHGVRVGPVPADDANTAVMYSLMSDTRDRAGFLLRPYDYFRTYWQLQEAAGQGQLFFATLNGTVLAGLFATFLGKKGWYKDGGSSKQHPEVMAPHLLQWEVMRWLRERRVELYDLVAVPPADALSEAHPLYGLYRFKSGFESSITEFVGTLDLVLDPVRFRIWDSVLERAAQQWSFRVRHDLFY